VYERIGVSGQTSRDSLGGTRKLSCHVRFPTPRELQRL